MSLEFQKWRPRTYGLRSDSTSSEVREKYYVKQVNRSWTTSVTVFRGHARYWHCVALHKDLSSDQSTMYRSKAKQEKATALVLLQKSYYQDLHAFFLPFTSSDPSFSSLSLFSRCFLTHENNSFPISGGTALPICLRIAFPLNTWPCGNVCRLANSRSVSPRLPFGWPRPFAPAVVMQFGMMLEASQGTKLQRLLP